MEIQPPRAGLLETTRSANGADKTQREGTGADGVRSVKRDCATERVAGTGASAAVNGGPVGEDNVFAQEVCRTNRDGA